MPLKTTKNIILAFSTLAFIVPANAGFFDNFASNLQSGDFGSLITDAVSDVADEIKKNADNASEIEESEYMYDDEDEDSEDEYSEETTTNNWSSSYNAVNDTQEQSGDYSNTSSNANEEYVVEDDKFADLRQQYFGSRVVDDIHLKSEDMLSGFSGFFSSDEGSSDNEWRNNKSITYYYKDEKVPYSGVSVGYYTNGSRQVVWRFKDGMIDGLKQTKWYEDGVTKLSETDYKDGMAKGEHVEYFLNGKFKLSVSQVSDLYHGTLTQWYENGQKSSETLYEEGRVNGPVQKWYESGLIKQSGFSVRGIKYGSTINYNQNGEVDSCTVVQDSPLAPTSCFGGNSGSCALQVSECTTAYTGVIANEGGVESHYYSMPKGKIERLKEFESTNIEGVKARVPTYYELNKDVYHPNDNKFHDFDRVVNGQMPVLNSFINPISVLLSADTSMIQKGVDGLFYHKEVSLDKPYSGSWSKVVSSDSNLGIYDLSATAENQGFAVFEMIAFTAQEGKIIEVVAKTNKRVACFVFFPRH